MTRIYWFYKLGLGWRPFSISTTWGINRLALTCMVMVNSRFNIWFSKRIIMNRCWSSISLSFTNHKGDCCNSVVTKTDGNRFSMEAKFYGALELFSNGFSKKSKAVQAFSITENKSVDIMMLWNMLFNWMILVSCGFLYGYDLNASAGVKLTRSWVLLHDYSLIKTISKTDTFPGRSSFLLR